MIARASGDKKVPRSVAGGSGALVSFYQLYTRPLGKVTGIYLGSRRCRDFPNSTQPGPIGSVCNSSATHSTHVWSPIYFLHLHRSLIYCVFDIQEQETLLPSPSGKFLERKKSDFPSDLSMTFWSVFEFFFEKKDSMEIFIAVHSVVVSISNKLDEICLVNNREKFEQINFCWIYAVHSKFVHLECLKSRVRLGSSIKNCPVGKCVGNLSSS